MYFFYEMIKMVDNGFVFSVLTGGRKEGRREGSKWSAPH